MPSNIRREDLSLLDPLLTYNKYRDEIKTGDLIEFASDTLLGKIIRFGSRQEVNHTAFAWKLDSYSQITDRLFLLEALNAGLEWNSLSGRLASFKGKVYWSQLVVDNATREQMLAIAVQKATQIREKKRYDYLSLFRNAYKYVNINERAWFCSEFYHYLLISIGLLPHGEKARRPGQFKDNFFLIF